MNLAVRPARGIYISVPWRIRAQILRWAVYAQRELLRSFLDPAVAYFRHSLCPLTFTGPVMFLTTRRLFRLPILTPYSPPFLVARYSYTMSLANASTSLKVLFIGDPKVGISSFLTVLRGKPFPNLYIPTHADIVDLHAIVPHYSPTEDSKAWEDWPNLSEPTDSNSPTTNSTIQLLDITTYGEIYRWSKEVAYRGPNAVVLCFSVARRESFESLKTKVRLLNFRVEFIRVISAVFLVAPTHCAIAAGCPGPSRRNEKRSTANFTAQIGYCLSRGTKTSPSSSEVRRRSGSGKGIRGESIRGMLCQDEYEEYPGGTEDGCLVGSSSFPTL